MNVRALHVRLVLWYTALAIATAAAFAAYTYANLSHRLYDDIGQTLARRVAHIRDDVLRQGAEKSLPARLRDLYSPEKSNRFIRISEQNGKILYVSGPPEDGSFRPGGVPRAAGYTDGIEVRVSRPPSGSPLVLAGTEAGFGGRDYVIEMGAPTSQIEDTLAKLVKTLLLGLPAVVAIAAFGGSLLVKSALGPVDAIRSTAEKITFDNPRQRLPVNKTGDALEQLSVTLNRMLERLETAYQQASRFSADASHELRTPLTVMRSELESLVRAESVPLPYRERAGSVLEEAERLSGIVEGLLSIAQLEAGDAARRETFDLGALAAATLEQMQLLAEARRIAARCDAPQPVFVRGDAGRLKQVLVNLLDNAIKYTPPNGAVTVSVAADRGAAVLRVADNGIGIPETALPFVFDRFFRAGNRPPAAAEADEPEPRGAGLGLSLVQAVSRAHGGAARIESRLGLGTTVTVTLPLADSAAAKREAAA